jgi:PAS domain S-box-containing protein
VRMMMDRRETQAMVLENEVANVTLDSIGEAVLRTDGQGKIAYLNRKAEEMTGWRREEARGRPMADVLRLIENTG